MQVELCILDADLKYCMSSAIASSSLTGTKFYREVVLFIVQTTTLQATYCCAKIEFEP